MNNNNGEVEGGLKEGEGAYKRERASLRGGWGGGGGLIEDLRY